MMKNISPTLLLFIVATTCSQHIYAHGNDSGTSADIEKRDMERKEINAQKDRDTWDDFMKAVKEQENKPANSEAAEHTQSTDSLPANHNH